MKKILGLIVLTILLVGCNDHGVENGMTLFGYGIIQEPISEEDCLFNCPEPPVYVIRVGDNVFALHSEHEREPGDLVLVEFGVRWTNQVEEYDDMFETLMVRIVE